MAAAPATLQSLFPSTTTTPDVNYQASLQALQATLVRFIPTIQKRATAASYDVASSDDLRNFISKFVHVSNGEEVLAELQNLLSVNEKNIKDLETMQEVKAITDDLHFSSNIRDKVFEQVEKLLEHKDLAITLRDMINKAADQ